MFTGSERTPGANSDDFWASGSESEDGGGLPDGSGGILSPKRSGTCGINLREAMEKAKAQAENKVKVQASPTHLNAEGDSASSSDWDEEEEEEKEEKMREPSLSPRNDDTAHTSTTAEKPPLYKMAAGGEGNARGSGLESGTTDKLLSVHNVPKANMSRAGARMELGLGAVNPDSTPSGTESDSDLPLFGGYDPSTPQSATRSSLSRLPPISQGPPQGEVATLSLSPLATKTSLYTAATPLSRNDGTYTYTYTMYMYVCSLGHFCLSCDIND